MDIYEYLNSLPVRQLIAAMRYINGGPLGYDYMKFNKQELQEKACELARETGVSAKHVKYAIEGDEEEIDMGESQCGSGTGELSGAHRDVTNQKDLTPSKKEGGGDPQGWGGHDGDEATDENSEGAGQGSGGDGSGKEAMQAKGAEGSGDGEQQDNQPDKQDDAKDGDQSNETDEQKELREMVKELVQQEQKKSQKASRDFTQEELEKLVQQEMEKHARTYRIEVKSEGKPEKRVMSDKPRHQIFKEVLQAVKNGLHVLLVGPAGCGKTYLAEEVAQVLDLGFKFTGAVQSEYKLLGFMSAQGNLVRTPYRDAYEHGELFLWDELDASGAQAMLSFNAGLANGHQDFPDGIIPRHERFRAMASANTYGHGADRMYVGRNQLDAASLDRFYTTYMDYDESLELELYGDNEWVRYVHKARRAVRALGERHVVSMRAIDMGLKMKGSGIPRIDVERAVLWKNLTDDQVKKIRGKMAS